VGKPASHPDNSPQIQLGVRCTHLACQAISFTNTRASPPATPRLGRDLRSLCTRPPFAEPRLRRLTSFDRRHHRRRPRLHHPPVARRSLLQPCRWNHGSWCVLSSWFFPFLRIYAHFDRATTPPGCSRVLPGRLHPQQLHLHRTSLLAPLTVTDGGGGAALRATPLSSSSPTQPPTFKLNYGTNIDQKGKPTS
jgi:hypothetical protein